MLQSCLRSAHLPRNQVSDLRVPFRHAAHLPGLVHLRTRRQGVCLVQGDLRHQAVETWTFVFEQTDDVEKAEGGVLLRDVLHCTGARYQESRLD